ncbi:anhydro-N-acetylmuramic acid kinase [Colwellia ponticola]|uniref:Anhydro-N-acetylmuramic acid kinase n=1 Tax=Colwellia ponticola TaxID=2304625 RepID=A0A8H2JQ83_9GAMM|nr:anhydro-N-acetylmuramic acid kinase [Colwellia ponticola]TMM47920.1 anhydro-N-acetylmuramic acid kinase [Colwellia ponticola]
MINQQKVQGQYYIGLMSGTSADGIDLALVDFSQTDKPPILRASFYQSYSHTITKQITSLYQPDTNEVDRAFHLDSKLAHLFAQAIKSLLNQEQLTPDDIIAIGNHGQTIRHRPSGNYPFTLQIGCCQTLAMLTGIRVVGQFRVKDMALGGQGAPLVPIFHQQLFRQSTHANFVVNIGGIANITYLPAQGAKQTVLGFDTGPGNALLDDWFSKHHPNSEDKFDKNGTWASKGQENHALLTQFLQDNYIKEVAPKSTGREYFHLDWLEQQLAVFTASTQSQYETVANNVVNKVANKTLTAVDIQATLLAFTAHSISDAITALTLQGNVYLCGGGVHNNALVNALKERLHTCANSLELSNIQSLNIDGDILEAMAFAWFAYAFDHGFKSNLPAVTGARASCTLGNSFNP